VPLETRIAAIREVDWRRVQPNFFVVFAPAALREAPASHIVTARVNSAAQSAQIQRSVVATFANISAIDLMLILQTLDGVFTRISFAVQFMASFIIGTGLLVLIGTVLTGRYQRIRESVLLRSLGASRWQVLQVLLAEHLALGLLSAVVGALLASAAGWALTRFVFQTGFMPAITPLLSAIILVPAISVGIGLLASRGILNHPPLAVLRSE
jgi:putative ABC transport system permease protein